jgi:DNA polymerase III subunit delta'
VTEPTSAFSTLSSKLCPWLRPALTQLETAHAAKRLGHGWLLAGPAGIGKINLALVLAGRLLARETPAGPPTQLSAPDAVAAMRDRHTPVDHHPDLHWLFPEEDKRTISVEQIRDAAETLTLRSHAGGAKVVVIEPADGMTSSAANALLKTLEEPSGDTYLMLLSHQPQRLPATIRSRCQRLNLARPPAEELATWLGVTADVLAPAWLLTGGSPLQTAALLANGALQNNALDKQLALVSRDELEVQAVAEEWVKGDPELALTWLTRELHRQIRLRLAPAVSTSVTDRDGGMLHNAWSKLSLRRLFEQYDTAERLLNQLGSGINMELALQAMLLGFQGNRGRP